MTGQEPVVSHVSVMFAGLFVILLVASMMLACGGGDGSSGPGDGSSSNDTTGGQPGTDGGSSTDGTIPEACQDVTSQSCKDFYNCKESGTPECNAYCSLAGTGSQAECEAFAQACADTSSQSCKDFFDCSQPGTSSCGSYCSLSGTADQPECAPVPKPEIDKDACVSSGSPGNYVGVTCPRAHPMQLNGKDTLYKVVDSNLPPEAKGWHINQSFGAHTSNDAVSENTNMSELYIITKLCADENGDGEIADGETNCDQMTYDAF